MQNYIYSSINSFFLVPEIFLILNSLVLIFFLLSKNIKTKLFLNVNLTYKNSNTFILMNIIYFSIFLLIATSLLFLNLFNHHFLYSFGSLLINNFTILIKLLILLFTCIVIFFCFSYFKSEFEFKSFEFFVLLLMSTSSMLLLVSSNDFLSLYLTLELQSLCLYVLAGFKQSSILSIEAGLKYFVLGSFVSGLLLFGSSLVYGITGTINFFDLSLFISCGLTKNKFLVLFGLFLILSTVLFKFTAAPFHMWAPDVYEGAPTIVTFYFSVVPKITFFGIIVRLIHEVFSSLDFFLFTLLVASSALSLIFGSITSLYQLKIKRFLTYSSIANVGFFLLAVNCGTEEGFASGLTYLFLYLVILTGLFSFLLSIRYSHNKLKLKSIGEFAGLINANPIYSIFFLINFFSLIGIPPLSGFVGKFYLFLISFNSELFLLFFLSILASIFSTSIYLKIIRLFFFNKEGYFYLYTPLSRIFITFSIFTTAVNFLTIFFTDHIIKLCYVLFFANF
jgi:NADH-quinone oxidoreductase subunit N